jgi:hypothetical protein
VVVHLQLHQVVQLYYIWHQILIIGFLSSNSGSLLSLQ